VLGTFNQNTFATITSTSDDCYQLRADIFTQQQNQRREFSSNRSTPSSKHGHETPSSGGVRLSVLLAKHLGLSRRQSERMILTERVTLFGDIVTSPTFSLTPSSDPNQNSSTAMKVDGKLIHGVQDTLKLLYLEQQKQQQQENDSSNAATNNKNGNGVKRKEKEDYSNTRIWLANKFKGELITEDDPVGRPSMLQRLTRGGVGKVKKKKDGTPTAPLHLKPVGRLDMMTEGLMIFTNDGKYARELELPSNRLWRTYRVRVHGRLTMGKLKALRNGLTVRVNDNIYGGSNNHASGEVVQKDKIMKYKGIKVSIERKNFSKSRSKRGGGGARGPGGGTNTWLRITCAEGKNRQLRRMLGSLGLDVTRLIRISYGDYDLNTIPPGLAVEVPCKGLEGMKKKGNIVVGGAGAGKKNEKEVAKEEKASAVQWVTYS